MTPPPPEAVAAIREFVFLHALKGGTTTIIDVGGLRGDWDGYARLVDDLGVRDYGSPTFRDRNTFMGRAGPAVLRPRRGGGGRGGLQGGAGVREEVRRLRRRAPARHAQRGAGGDLHRVFAAGGQGRRALAEHSDIHTHAGGNLIEFERIMAEYRKTPIQFLADIGFLDERTLLGRRRLHHRASLAALSVRGRPARARPNRATVGHCPYKYAQDGDDAEELFSTGHPQGGPCHRPRRPFPCTRRPKPYLGHRSLARSRTPITRRGWRDVYNNAATLAGASSSAAPIWAGSRRCAKADLLLINLDHLGADVCRSISPWWTPAAAGTLHGYGQRQDPGAGRPRQSRGRGRGRPKVRQVTQATGSMCPAGAGQGRRGIKITLPPRSPCIAPRR